MYIKSRFREIILKFISLIPIKDKNLFRFKIRQIFICTLLYLYSFYPFSKFSRFFFYSLSDKFLNYEKLYNLVGFLKKKNEVKSVLEIGIGGHNKKFSGGYSLIAMRYFYKKAKIYGLDINDKKFLDSRNIKTFQGSQDDISLLNKIGDNHGPFDLIIDDGSHYVDHQLTSFKTLWRHLNNNGFYIIEDISGSYFTRLRGSPELEENKNLVTFFSKLNHMVNAESLLKKWIDQSKEYINIKDIYYFKNAIVIKKENYNKDIEGLRIEEAQKEFESNKNQEGSLNISDDF